MAAFLAYWNTYYTKIPTSTTLVVGDIEIGKIEIKDATTDKTAKVVEGNTAAVADIALVVADPNVLAKLELIRVIENDQLTSLQLLDNAVETNRFAVNPIAGQVGVAAGAGAVGATVPRMTLASDDPSVSLLKTLAHVWGEVYASPQDFTVAYSSTTALQLSATPFTVDDSACFVFGIYYKNVAGTWNTLVNTHNGVSIAASSGVVTVSGAGTPFLATDTQYRVIVLGQKKGYSSIDEAMKFIEQSPLWARYVLDSLLDAVNTAAATYYYPSATGAMMDGYKNLSITGKLVEGDAVLDTIEVQVTNDEDLVNATWISIYWYSPYINGDQNIITTASVAGTYLFAMDFTDLNFYAFRVKLVLADATNTVEIKARRTF
jgi:hypothetical protein